jgi:tetratricopeptide (TPR) repeat protein
MPKSDSSSTQPGKLAKSRHRRVVNFPLLGISVATVVVLSALGVWRYYSASSAAARTYLSRADVYESEKNWDEAAELLQRYLLAQPDDVEVRKRLTVAFSEAANTPGQRQRAIKALYQSIGHFPNDYSLRVRLAKLLRESGDFDAALKEASSVPADTDDEFAAAREAAIAKLALQNQDDISAISPIAAELLRIARRRPADFEVAIATADLFRQKPGLVIPDVADLAAAGDELVATTLSKNPENEQAWIAGYQFKRRYGLPDAAEVLATVRSKWPASIEAILFEAELAAAGKDPDTAKAEERLNEAIRLAPEDTRAYLLLSQMLAARQKHQEAVTVLAKARGAAPEDLQLGLQYVETLLNAGDTAKATEEFAQVARSARAIAPQLTGDARQLIENRVRILNARLALADGNFNEVVGPIQEVLTSTSNEPVEGRSRETLLALDLMAQGLAGLSKWDLAAGHWDQLAASLKVATDRANADPRLKLYRSAAIASAANAYQRAGMANEAAARFDELSTLTDSNMVIVRQLQSHLALQLRRPFEARSWDQFLAVLQKAKQVAAGRWEVAAAEAEYLNCIGKEADSVQCLRRLEEDANISTDGLRYLALAYQRNSLASDADRILERFTSKDVPESDQLLLRASLMLGRGETDAALEAMKNAELKAASPELALKLQLVRFQTMLRIGRPAEVIAEYRGLDAPKQSNVPLLMVAYESAIAARDQAAMDEWGKALAASEAGGTFDARYLNAIGQCEGYQQLSTAERDRLLREVTELRSERPKWGPAHALFGRVAELMQRTDEAVNSYKLSIELGDVRPKTFEQLINLLYVNGDTNDAQRYLSMAASLAAVDSQLESMAGAMASSRSDLQGLIRLAKESVERHPQDLQKRLWLSQLLLAKGDYAEAEKSFQIAADVDPGNQQAWLGKFSSALQAGKDSDAREMLASLVDGKEKLSVEDNFAAAIANEMLQDLPAARRFYEAGLSLAPDNETMRLRFASMLQRLDVAAASQQLEELLARNPQNIVARRQLAATLAVVGGDAEWRRITALLQSDQKSGGAVRDSNDERLRALLMTQRGSSREDRLQSIAEARAIMEAKISSPGAQPEDVDRLLLAGLIEQEVTLGGDPMAFAKAREMFVPMLARDGVSPQVLMLYARFLINASELIDASAVGSNESNSLRSEFLAEADKRLQETRASLADSAPPQELLRLLSLELSLKWAAKEPNGVASVLDEFIGTTLPTVTEPAERVAALKIVGDSYFRLNEFADAEKFYRTLAEIDDAGWAQVVQAVAAQGRPLDAVTECIALRERGREPAEIVSLLTALAGEFDEVRGSQQVGDFVNELLASNPADVSLLCAVAALRVSEGDNDDAIKLFREVVRLSPNHVLALNNLATLLGEVADKRGEAIQTVDAAIAIAGRRPALLDTKGTIYFNDGQFAEAIKCLEEAVAGDARDPRYYFHLAAAKFGAGDEAGAQVALGKARELKLDKSLLTAGDLQLLQKMERTPAVAPLAN